MHCSSHTERAKTPIDQPLPPPSKQMTQTASSHALHPQRVQIMYVTKPRARSDTLQGQGFVRFDVEDKMKQLRLVLPHLEDFTTDVEDAI